MHPVITDLACCCAVQMHFFPFWSSKKWLGNQYGLFIRTKCGRTIAPPSPCPIGYAANASVLTVR